jgi:hypothetical protein
MKTEHPDIGSYGVAQGQLLSTFEDECVGSSPQAARGIVVTRVDGDKMFVRDWTITSHFEGKQSLEKFEEAKHNQDFDVTFSDERERTEDDHLDGTDPILKERLRKKLKSRHGV